MYALEFETDISGQTLRLPKEIVSKINPGQHVRVIMLLDEAKPATKPAVKNPLATLLESELIGCAEADPKLSRNYKTELTKSLEKKHGYR